ncbi:hypothetical protein MAR_036038 [Mya arenaria]|uniref:Uncharacterized protein n=1 Tax=Mya arenaria TaxID=6604 RepID=A0ABY7EPT6_MYAAR|nr:hypothetical protein MAR_036038 [Mya arenaria]
MYIHEAFSDKQPVVFKAPPKISMPRIHRDLESDYDELPMGRCGSLSSVNSTTTTNTTDSSSSNKGNEETAFLSSLLNIFKMFTSNIL